jgi:hypothetical protein
LVADGVGVKRTVALSCRWRVLSPSSLAVGLVECDEGAEGEGATACSNEKACCCCCCGCCAACCTENMFGVEATVDEELEG